MSEYYLNTTHGVISCRGCHGGENAADWDLAHQNLVKNPASPSWNQEDLAFGVCDKCHGDVGELYATALHYTQNGYITALETYTHEGILETDNPVSFTWDKNCSNCHADCGECHVSRPRAQNGGLLNGHFFEKEPPMKDTCVGCHSTRHGAEFIGEVGPSADTHYYDYDMVCTDCHQVSNFHGTGTLAADMHALEDLPKCLDCHGDTMGADSEIAAHRAHDPDILDCTVCHSQEANGCQGCHVEFTDETKTAVTSSSEPLKAFKIALNPNRTDLVPYKYITVRHIPQVADMLAPVGYPKLEGYDLISNWQRSPTHNIQRFTPQNGDCSSCHGVEKFFLTEKDILPTDSTATQEMVVKSIPKAY